MEGSVRDLPYLQAVIPPMRSVTQPLPPVSQPPGTTLGQQLSRLELQLAALQEVPQQLAALQESTAVLHSRLCELGGVLPPPTAPGTEPPPPPPSPRTRPLPLTRGQAASRQLAGADARSTARSGTNTSSSTSLSERVWGMLPLVGQPARGPLDDEQRSGPRPQDETGVMQAQTHSRRPSTQSDDPSAMQAHLQRRPSVQSGQSGDMNGACVLRRPSCHSSDAVVSQVQLQHQRRPSKLGITSGGPFQRRPSTNSNHSAVSERFDTVSPHSIPSPREDDDGSSSGAKDGGDPHSERTDGWPPNAESLTSLSLGDNRPQSRPSIERGMSSIALLDLEEDGIGRNDWVIQPSSRARLAWDTCMLLLTVMVAIVVPVGLIYLEEGELTSGLCGALLRSASVAWLVDVVLNFRTGFARAGRVVLAPGRIAARYARTWLLLDLVVAWPLAWAPAERSVQHTLCGLKLLRLLRLSPLLSGLRKEPLVGLPVRVGLMVILITHATTCLWRVALRADDVPQTLPEGGEDDPNSWWAFYVADAYWVMTTMTTVGYGDMHPEGTGSRLFAILAMLVAPLFFGTIVSLLTHVTHGIFNDQVETQVAEAVRFLRLRRMPQELQRRVEHNLRYQIREESLALAPELYAKLSPAVQREVSLELLRSTVLQFPLFRDVLHSFIGELAQAHTWVKCLPGDLVAEEGQLMQEVVFVIRGRLVMHCGPGVQEGEGPIGPNGVLEVPRMGGVREVEVATGAWFGEASLFFSDRVRTATVFASMESELAVLTSNEYHRIVRKYPRLLKRHRTIERALRAGSINLREISYVPPRQQMAEERFLGLPPVLSWWRGR